MHVETEGRIGGLRNLTGRIEFVDAIVSPVMLGNVKKLLDEEGQVAGAESVVDRD